MIFRCFYLPAVNQFATFVKTDSGKCEAASGNFDDWVMGIGIGLFVNVYTAVAMPRNYVDAVQEARGNWACS
jgi:hypothetical protein